MQPKRVFIVTYGRSGSTLLQAVLNGTPGYLIRGENKNALFGLMQSVKAAGYGKAIHKGSSTSNSSHPWFGASAIDTQAYSDALVSAFEQNIIRPTGKERAIGFKEISYFLDESTFSEYVDFLLSAFLDPYIIFNIRDPERVSRSGWWANSDPVWVQTTISRYSEMMREYDRSCNRSILLNYDEFSNEPGALRPLFEFLGESFDSSAVETVLGERLTH
jgi:hypothetical protein